MKIRLKFVILVFVLASVVLKGETCDYMQAVECINTFGEVMDANPEITQLCKIRDSALADLEQCVIATGCSVTDYVDPQRTALEAYDEYCQPEYLDCGDFYEKSLAYANCSLITTEIQSNPEKTCEIMQRVSDCQYEVLSSCPKLEQEYYNMTINNLKALSGMCSLTYGGKPLSESEGSTCNQFMISQCSLNIGEILATNTEIDQICKVKDQALADFEKCVADAGCNVTQYVAPYKQTFDMYSGYCQPGCEDFEERILAMQNCSSDMGARSDKICEYMKNVTDCMAKQISGCPLMEQQYGDMPRQTLDSYKDMCNFDNQENMTDCVAAGQAIYLCMPADFTLLDYLVNLDFTNRDMCKQIESIDWPSFKMCVRNIEKKSPSCFYPIEDTTDVDETVMRMPMISGLFDVFDSLCSPDCDLIEQVYIAVSTCLPKPSANVMVALNATSHKTSSEMECIEVENWIKGGVACAQELVGDCLALEYAFNHLGLIGFVNETQDQEVSYMYQNSHSFCNISLTVSVEEQTTQTTRTVDYVDACGGLLAGFLTVFVTMFSILVQIQELN